MSRVISPCFPSCRMVAGRIVKGGDFLYLAIPPFAAMIRLINRGWVPHLSHRIACKDQVYFTHRNTEKNIVIIEGAIAVSQFRLFRHNAMDGAFSHLVEE